MPTGYAFVSKTDYTGVVPDTGAPSVDVVFTNRYISAKAKIEGTKEFKNGTIAENQFSFTLSSKDGTHLPSETTVYNDAEGNITFGDMTYVLSDLDDVTEVDGKKTKIYTYTLTEVVPASVTKANPVSGGIKYDTHSEEIKVTVVYDTATHEMTATPDELKADVTSNT